MKSTWLFGPQSKSTPGCHCGGGEGKRITFPATSWPQILDQTNESPLAMSFSEQSWFCFQIRIKVSSLPEACVGGFTSWDLEAGSRRPGFILRKLIVTATYPEEETLRVSRNLGELISSLGWSFSLDGHVTEGLHRGYQHNINYSHPASLAPSISRSPQERQLDQTSHSWIPYSFLVSLLHSGPNLQITPVFSSKRCPPKWAMLRVDASRKRICL